MPESSRDEIDRLITSGDGQATRRALEKLWLQSPGPATAGFVVSRFEQLRGTLTFTPCRVAILRSFTVEPVVPLLRAMAFIGGIDLDVRLGDFNAYPQEILDLSSWLYAWKPDVVILAVQTRDISPALWDGFADLDADGAAAEVGRTIATLANLVDRFRAANTAHLIVHSLQIPATAAQGLLDSHRPIGQANTIRQINDVLKARTLGLLTPSPGTPGEGWGEGLLANVLQNPHPNPLPAYREREPEPLPLKIETAHVLRNVYFLDYNALISRHGEAAWDDERKWLTARMPIAADKLIYLAAEWLRFLHPITGRICKVLAVDLDNTLWGGVIGEDGIDGIKLDDTYPGAAYRAVQRALLDFYRRGILLAICSKNNSAEAMDVIKNHPGMLLKPEHFAAVRINWADKASNLREITGELNVGIDSVAFLDDNPIEREWIRAQVPEVTVIELPPDPLKFAQTLRESPVFERLELTEADETRGRVYSEQRQRTELQKSATSLEDFYRSLEMRVRVEPVNSKSLTRAAQLTQKTNQFNLTTRRYSEEQLSRMVVISQSLDVGRALPAITPLGGQCPPYDQLFSPTRPMELSDSSLQKPFWRAFTLQVTDRFGDNGIVGVAIFKIENSICEIDTFLLSCRVIGRTIETAFLAAVGREAVAAGAKHLIGWFIPTRKNAPAADFYQRHGFARLREQDGAVLWELDLTADKLAVPPWIVMEGISP